MAVARFRFRFRATFLIMLLIVQMLPAAGHGHRAVPRLPRLGLLDNLVGLILVYAAQALPVSIWMLRNFVAAVPEELEEAAAIDGAGPIRGSSGGSCSRWSRPGLVATSIFAFITA